MVEPCVAASVSPPMSARSSSYSRSRRIVRLPMPRRAGMRRQTDSLPVVRYNVKAGERSLDIITTSPNTLCGASQPDAGGFETRSLAGLARGGVRRRLRTQDPACADPLGRDDMLAGECAGRKRQE